MAKIIMKGVVLLFVRNALIDVCESCDSGYYADTDKCLPCLENCIACSSASSCDSCRVGYYGESCSQVCPDHCHDNECIKTSGLCITCSKGYYSGDNKSCIKCPENCTTCNSPQYCFACKSGYKGKACEDKCTTCRPGTSCDKQTGYCLESCKAGLSGDLCTTNCDDKCTFCERSNERACISCAHNRFGDSCNIICSKTCLNQTCRDSDGVCTYGEKEENPPICGSHSSTGITTGVAIVGTLELIFIVVIVGFFIVYRKRIHKYTACKWRYRIPDQLSRLRRSQTQDESQEPEMQSLAMEEKPQIKYSTSSPKHQSASANVDVEIGKEEDKGILRVSRRRQTRGNKSENKGKGKDLMKDDRPTSLVSCAFFVTKFPSVWDHIATDEPTETILRDGSEFWKIIIDERCCRIIMLTSSRENEDVQRFDQYLFCSLENKYITILNLSGYNYADYAVRTFTVKRQTEERKVSIFRYIAWPDKWGPGNILSLLEFCKTVNAVETHLDGPTLVHSSAGIHRCTTYIAFDMLRKEGKETRHDDVRACLQHLKRHRLQINLEDTEFLTQMMVHPPSSAKLEQENKTMAKLKPMLYRSKI